MVSKEAQEAPTKGTLEKTNDWRALADGRTIFLGTQTHATPGHDGGLDVSIEDITIFATEDRRPAKTEGPPCF